MNTTTQLRAFHGSSEIKQKYIERVRMHMKADEIIQGYYLLDRIFEGLPNSEAKGLPLAFIEGIREGADLSSVLPRFFVWLLTDKEQSIHL